MSIGARWKQAREAAGLSAARAATLTDLHENTIYLLENDTKNDGVTLRVCKQVAAAYGATLSDIFCDSQRGVPVELRPLVDLLRPLDADTRGAFVKNVVTNAKFMAQLLAYPDGDGVYTSAPKQITDEPGVVDGILNTESGSVRELRERHAAASLTTTRENRRKTKG